MILDRDKRLALGRRKMLGPNTLAYFAQVAMKEFICYKTVLFVMTPGQKYARVFVSCTFSES